MQYKFRSHKITRTCYTSFTDYHDYKPFLEKDFHCRCAYCNLKKDYITTPFEIDHFIPRRIFSGKWDECDNLYENLIYCCKKCNIAKSSKYSGNLIIGVIENNDFYNPVTTDYNSIFYRNEYGFICSNDKKGRDIILKLKLYHPIHALEWMLEKIDNLANLFEEKINNSASEEQKQKYELLLQKSNKYYRKLNKIFIKNYNNKFFSLSEEIDLANI